MFKPIAPIEPNPMGVTNSMVDDDGTTISFLGRGSSGEWHFEYWVPAIDFRFRFAAARNDTDLPSAPPGDWWKVAFSVPSLVPAILSHPHIDPDQFEATVRSRISEALLNWPLDRIFNTIKAKSVSYYKNSSDKHSLREWAATAVRERQRNRSEKR